jgi:triacylglycerol esterase/lipase EstA (alpha/beta hydrolase family)
VSRLRLAVVAAAFVFPAAIVPAGAATAGGRPPYPVQYEVGTAAALAALNPAVPPPGVDLPCTSTSRHPYPVILIDGTHANMELNWGGLGPTLANAGYCVYSAAIGGDPHSYVQTCGPVLQSVKEIAALVEHVLAITGATKVDLVGHSQGGLIAEYYTKFDGPGLVDTVVGLAPTTHGGTMSGLVSLPAPFGPLATDAIAVDCAAVYDQVPTAAVVHQLNTGPVAVAGVHYTVIETRYEEVVTPAPQAAFIDEPGVHNIVVQDYCPTDTSDHVNLAYSVTAWQLVTNALDPAHARRAGCRPRS